VLQVLQSDRVGLGPKHEDTQLQLPEDPTVSWPFAPHVAKDDEAVVGRSEAKPAGVVYGPTSKPSNSIASILGIKVFPSFSPDEKACIDRAFAAAMHETSSDFDFFDHPKWQFFFDLIAPNWRTPPPSTIGTDLLNTTYTQQQIDMLHALGGTPAIILGLDAATDVHSKSKTNLMAHDPQPWFLEYLAADLKKETAEAVVDKVEAAIGQLDALLGKSLVTAVMTDSCNTMRAFRSKIVTKGVVSYAYGCAAHPLHNLCEDLTRLEPIRATFTGSVFVSKKIRRQGLCNKVFSSVCKELVGKSLSMVLYSPTRWSSANFMFCRLRRCKRALMALPSVIENEKDEREIDSEFELPEGLAEKLVDGGFWRGIDSAISIMDPICKALGALEADASSMSTAYAAFVFVYVHLATVPGLATCRDVARACLLRRWARIYSPVHALAYFCDPFYYGMRQQVVATVGVDAIELGQGDLDTQCRNAITLLAAKELPNSDGTTYNLSLLGEFMRFCIAAAAFAASNASISHFHPKLVWAQADAQFPVLSKCLVKVFCGPGLAAGVERNHKVSANVHTALRNRIGAGKVERQVAVAHNASVANRGTPSVRHEFAKVMAKTCGPEAVVFTVAENELHQAERLCAESQVPGQGDVDGLQLLLTPDELLEQEVLQHTLESGLGDGSGMDDLLSTGMQVHMQ